VAEVFKVLAQSAPAAATLTAIYTVPASTSTTISTITVCNPTNATIKCRISIAVAGAALSQKQYILYDVPILKTSMSAFTLGITLAATDVLNVYSDTATVSFNIFGVEFS
jgi:hypothetical protein